MLVHRRVTPSSKFTGTHLYTWVERGTMGVKCLAQEHNTVPRPGLEPGPFDPESSALTIRPPRLPFNCKGLGRNLSRELKSSQVTQAFCRFLQVQILLLPKWPILRVGQGGEGEGGGSREVRQSTTIHKL